MVKKKIKKAIRGIVNLRYARLNEIKFGLAGGIVSGIMVLFMILWNSIMPEGMSVHMMMLSEMYGFFGYGMNALGIILGTIYAFIDGFILTFIFAWIYNKLL